jgi:hypothetical protein
MNYWIVNSEKVMIACGDEAFKNSCSIGPDQVWLECDPEVAVGNHKVSGEWPELSLIDGSADKAGPKWAAMRAERDAKLAACDWTQMPDSPLGATPKADWAAYRTLLRDLPAETADPESVTWPTQP